MTTRHYWGTNLDIVSAVCSGENVMPGQYGATTSEHLATGLENVELHHPWILVSCDHHSTNNIVTRGAADNTTIALLHILHPTNYGLDVRGGTTKYLVTSWYGANIIFMNRLS